ncbi:peptidoglycan-binding protein (plasmid) [Paraclostridium ghonii]|uniref:peptidoglycan-binding domain-containing protein n=1 Tax=Paraclostridium ghonii TaxID=29358 RepID=UPI00202CF686|nr:peptidoglycan-binding protein [Paeniclostridium ghonii]MCM0165420.1 peptidoglycan-binding protein [Paeniclostridium ghonii]
MQQIDSMVLETQNYLNRTYSGNPDWIRVDPDGRTGWGTIRGLIRALQIETGISTPNGNFGPATEAACPTLNEDLNPSEKTKRLVYILQGAMWCKGFSPGGFTGTFGDGTEAGVKKFQSSSGLEGTNVNGIADPMIFKALLNMDAFVLVSSGDPKIREIQMCLNRDYHKWIGLRPTDGRYGRDTNKALIYAIQVEEGIAQPNGTFGPQTQSLLPTLAPGSKNTPFVKIMQYALYCNRFDPTGFTGVFGNGTLNALKKFQEFCMLTADGYCGKSTWCSLMIS